VGMKGKNVSSILQTFFVTHKHTMNNRKENTEE